LKIVELKCPKSLNIESKGFLKVTILGERKLHATQIDPGSVRLEGVLASGYTVEDVAGSLRELAGRNGRNGSADDGPDGINDLTLRFDSRKIVEALGIMVDEDLLVLELTGNLNNGTQIIGEDIVTVSKRGPSNLQRPPRYKAKRNNSNLLRKANGSHLVGKRAT